MNESITTVCMLPKTVGVYCFSGYTPTSCKKLSHRKNFDRASVSYQRLEKTHPLVWLKTGWWVWRILVWGWTLGRIGDRRWWTMAWLLIVLIMAELLRVGLVEDVIGYSILVVTYLTVALQLQRRKKKSTSLPLLLQIYFNFQTTPIYHVWKVVLYLSYLCQNHMKIRQR